jgi:chloride channel 7
VADSINMNILLFFPTILIGATCGVLGALFTFINLKWAKFRRRAIAPVKALRVLEPMVIMLLFASLSVLLPLAFGCTSASKAHPGLLEEGALVRLSCPAGSYNELATLVYASGHKAVLLLFSRRAESLQPDNTLAYVGRETFGGGSVAVFFVIYYVLAAISAGSAISSGLVVPMLLIGACIGRLYGILVLGALGQADDPLTHCEGPHPWPTACYYSYVDPGACALIGAAAFFGGVSRLTIALTVIMIEITNDIRFLLPIMLSVMVAKWVADSITHSLYHAIIEAKCLPFLNPEVTLHGAKDGDLERFTIADLLKVVQHGPVMSLSAGAAETLGSVARLLQETRHGAYPVLDVHGRFEGTVSRDQLIAVLAEAASGGGSPDAFTRDPNGNGYLALLTAAEEANHGEYEAALERCATDPSLSGKPCDLSAYVNASAFSLRSNFSLHRAYMLFRTMGLRHLIVTDVENLVVGVITRRDLMDFQLHEVLHPHGHGHH